MSAVLILAQEERVSVISDAACYTPDGVLRAIRSKLTVLAEPGCVIVRRGHADCGDPPAWRPPATFDLIAQALPELVETLATATQGTIEVTAAGWSESRRTFEAWGASNISPGDLQGVAMLSGYSPGQSIQLPRTWGAPGWVEAQAPWFGQRWRGVDRELICPEEFGRDALRAMRVSAQWEDAEGRPIAGAIVGGFAEMAQVTRDSVSRRIIGEWPDRPGAMVDRRAEYVGEMHEPDARAAFLGRAA